MTNDLARMRAQHERERDDLMAQHEDRVSLLNLRISAMLRAHSSPAEPEIRKHISGEWLNKCGRLALQDVLHEWVRRHWYPIIVCCVVRETN